MGKSGGGGGVQTHETFQKQGPSPAARTLGDLAQRGIIGQLTTAQDLPIPVPFQQAVSGIQDLLPGMFQAFQGGGSLASRLAPGGAGGGPTGFNPSQLFGAPSMQSFQPTAAPTFGRTQTRTELGLPASRREAFGGELGLPSLQTVADEVGLPPIRPGKPTKVAARDARKFEKKTAKLRHRIETRSDHEKATARREKKLAKYERKLGGVIE